MPFSMITGALPRAAAAVHRDLQDHKQPRAPGPFWLQPQAASEGGSGDGGGGGYN